MSPIDMLRAEDKNIIFTITKIVLQDEFFFSDEQLERYDVRFKDLLSEYMRKVLKSYESSQPKNDQTG